MIFDPNPLFYVMAKYWIEHKNSVNPDTGQKSRVVICNEGSSRSSKTWDTIHFIVKMCDDNRIKKGNGRKPLNVVFLRKTLKSCREILYDVDFKPCLQQMELFSQCKVTGENQSPTANLWGNIIKFRGMDDGEEFGKTDIIFYNEALDEDDEKIVNSLLMRCEMLAIFDWNPKYTFHWIFKWEGRFNTLFTKTTYRNNKHLNPIVKADIESKCPWDFKDFDFKNNEWKVPEDKRSVNKANFHNNSIDRWAWLVYGEGRRCPQEGTIIKKYTWIKSFPEEVEEIGYGLDFGFTADPSALVKIGRTGKKLFIEKKLYEPIDNPELLYLCLEPALDEEIERQKSEGIENPLVMIRADSKDVHDGKEFVKQLNVIAQSNGKPFWFIKTKKIGVVAGLGILNKFDLYFVEDSDVKIELENYVYKIIEGRPTNIPIDKFNHAIDAIRYKVVDDWKNIV